ncbi:hypothetical protein MKX01_040427 [Papaver californicum]|nr:hypothetical protein MKX01_040427 [Papaver californicum]
MLSYLHDNLPSLALETLRKQIQFGGMSALNENTFAIAFKSCCGNLKTGSQIHGLAISSGFDSYVTVHNSLMSFYCKSGQFNRAFEIFRSLENPDIVSWNTILSGFQCSEDAVEFAAEMHRKGVVFDAVTYTTVISFCSDPPELLGIQIHSQILKSGFGAENFVACGHVKNLNMGRQVHSLALRTGYGVHVSVCNVLISMYSKCEITHSAKMVFESMTDRNVVSWTTMISLNEETAVSLFKEMRLDEVCPNEVTYVGLIQAISTQDLVKGGKMIHGCCIKTGFITKLNVSNSFTTMYAKFESMEDSKKVFNELNHKEIVSWNALISGYAQNGLYLEALETFVSAILESLQPNKFTFGSVLSAIASAEPVILPLEEEVMASTACFIIVSKNDIPVYEAEVGSALKKEEAAHQHQFILHSALDVVQDLAWTTSAMFLKTVDRFNDLVVSIYVAAGHILQNGN